MSREEKGIPKLDQDRSGRNMFSVLTVESDSSTDEMSIGGGMASRTRSRLPLSSEDSEENSDGLSEDSTIMDSDDEPISFLEFCWNCKRQYRGNIGFMGCLSYVSIDLKLVESKHIGFTRKLCNLRRCDVNDVDEVALCRQCDIVIMKNHDMLNQHKLSDVAWPAYVWSLLRDDELRCKHGLDLWKFVPVLWREAWLNFACRFDELRDITMAFPESYFNEITMDRYRLMGAIQGLKWMEMVRAIDDLGAIPSVKCPWGCSEFINKGNYISLDVVFEHYLRKSPCPRYYSSKTDGLCMPGCRGDFLKSYFILHNPAWKCSPSIYHVPGVGPCIATCNFHSRASRGMYFHVPTSPTGTIMSSGSDQFAPAVAVPKTVHAARSKKYSNTYQMNRMEGHYQGIDTLTISDRGRFDINDVLSDDRDTLSLAARPELRDHLAFLAKQGCIPEWLHKEKLDAVAKEIPLAKLYRYRQDNSNGATYLSFEDAMELERVMKWNRTAVVEMLDSHSKSFRLHYRGGWPLCIVWLHPATGIHGARPSLVPNTSRKEDHRCLWFVTALISTSPLLWKYTWENLQSVDEWMGWVLTYATAKCFTNRKVVSSKSNPFKRKVSEQFLNELLMKTTNSPEFDVLNLHGLFNSWQRVITLRGTDCEDCWKYLTFNADHINVVIILFEIGQLPLLLEYKYGQRIWELKTIIVDGNASDQSSDWKKQLYSRHGGSELTGWWVQSRLGKTAVQPLESSLPQVCLAKFDVAVYGKKTRNDFEPIRNAYLKSMGGQDSMRCLYHDTPLVIAPFKCDQKCFECTKEVYYICPIDKCYIGVCRKHHIVEGSHTVPVNADIQSVEVDTDDQGIEDSFDSQFTSNSTSSSSSSSSSSEEVEWSDNEVYVETRGGNVRNNNRIALNAGSGENKEEDEWEEFYDEQSYYTANEWGENAFDGITFNSIDRNHSQEETGSASFFSTRANEFGDSSSKGSDDGGRDDSNDGIENNGACKESDGDNQDGGGNDEIPLYVYFEEDDIVDTEAVIIVQKDTASYLEECNSFDFDTPQSDGEEGSCLDRCETSIQYSASDSEEMEAQDDDALGSDHESDNDGNEVVYCDAETDHLEPDEVVENEEQDLIIPTTNAGRVTTTFAFDRAMIGCHVILNMHGRLLVRKNNKLIGTRRQRNFLQRIAATASRYSIPLVYPEGMLFPSIFWDGKSDGSVVGAIPAACLTDDTSLRGHGIASLQDHATTRLLDSSLLTSTDHRYHFFSFDTWSNLALRGQDSRIILSRGYAEWDTTKDGRRLPGEEDRRFFDNESMDSRANVNRLTGALGEHMASLFFTHTCNMKDHFGIRVIKAWLDSEAAIDAVIEATGMTDVTFDQRLKIKRQLLKSSCLLSLRCWINVCLLYFKYIAESSEMPIGEVLKMWLRAEFQEHIANLFHVHSIIWLAGDDGTPEGIQKTINRIRGAIFDMAQSQEVKEFLDDGIVSSYHELVDILSNLALMLRHRHDRRCMVLARTSRKRSHDIFAPGSPEFIQDALQTELRCKVVDNRALSLTPQMHSFLTIMGNHNEAAVHVLSVIGLVRIERGPDMVDGYKITYLHEGLLGRRHIPRTSGEDDIISPVLARLIIMNPCSNNVQYLDSYGVCRYLAKYCTYVDESNRVYIKAQNAADFKVNFEKIGNTKISGILMRETKKNRKKPSQGRLVSQAETLMRLLNHQMVYTNLRFQHVPSVPLEERSAFDRIPFVRQLQNFKVVHPNASNISDLDASKVLPIFVVRQSLGSNLPAFRQFRQSECVLALDQMVTPMSLDGITLFGLRPPELRFVYNPLLYHRWFVRSKLNLSKEQRQQGPVDGYVAYLNAKLNIRYARCEWVDSTLSGIRVRAAALQFIIPYIRSSPVAYFGSRQNKNVVLAHFIRLERCFKIEKSDTGFRSTAMKMEWAYLKYAFLAEHDQAFVPVVWLTTIKPVHTERFLIHILLSMGRYINELELMASGSLRNAFVLAGLFDETADNPSHCVNRLTKLYVLEQLKNQPGGSAQFDRHCLAAYRGFNELILYDRIATDGLPPVLYTHLRQVTHDDIQSKLDCFGRRMSICVLAQIKELHFVNLPNIAQLTSARASRADPSYIGVLPSPWTAEHVGPSDGQPAESYQEQASALKMATESIRQYVNASLGYCPKSVIIVGGPGTGKTTIMLLLMLHAINFGLNVCVTALLSERALQLGGKHLHWLFMLPVRESSTPGRIAELAIAALLKTPWKLELLRRLDVLFLDEFGQVSAELQAVLDIILRRIRNSSLFMGGILLIATKDIMQLLPINGRPPMTSAHMISSYRFAKLSYSVRAARDANLRRIQTITRFMPTELTDEIIHEFESLIIKHCSFVADENCPTIPANAMFVYGRRDPVKQAKAKAVEKLKIVHDGHYSFRRSIDEECTTDGNWMSASTITKNSIDRKAKEPADLYFFEKGLYETTFNNGDNFSQSQLAILFDVPLQDHVDNWRPVEVYVSPPGCKEAPQNTYTKESLLQKGWTLQKVGCVPERSYTLGNNQKGRRRQYGLQHRVASTLHAVMGQTLASVVTRVYSDDGHLFTLWEKAQVVVLLSRTRLAVDLFFIGDPEKTAKALSEVLLRCSQYMAYMCYLLDNLIEPVAANVTAATTPIIIDQQLHPFRPVDVPLPENNSGCCYVLVSMARLEVTYIGQTTNLAERLNQHNSGHGSIQTMADHLRPWALLAYVVGFDGNRRQQMSFESEWKASRVEKQRLLRRRLTANEVADLAINVIYIRQGGIYHDESLRFVRAGTIRGE